MRAAEVRALQQGKQVMADPTLSMLGFVSGGAGMLAAVGSLYLATRQPEQRKEHLARAGLFAVIAAAMLFLP